MAENKIYIGTWPGYVGVSSIEAAEILENKGRQLADWRKDNEHIPDMLNKKLILKEENNETD